MDRNLRDSKQRGRGRNRPNDTRKRAALRALLDALSERNEVNPDSLLSCLEGYRHSAGTTDLLGAHVHLGRDGAKKLRRLLKPKWVKEVRVRERDPKGWSWTQSELRTALGSDQEKGASLLSFTVPRTEESSMRRAIFELADHVREGVQLFHYSQGRFELRGEPVSSYQVLLISSVLDNSK